MVKPFVICGAMGIVILGAATGIAWKNHQQSTAAQAQAASYKVAAKPAAQPSAMIVNGVDYEGQSSAIADPAHPAWKSTPAVPVLLNLTPRIYETDEIAGAPPDAIIRCVRASDGTVLLLTWNDPTKDQPVTRQPSPAGQGAGVRVQHTQMTNRFVDSAAVMVPVERKPDANPCLQMGEAGAPVEIYFWHSVKGPEVMKASGRGTTGRTGKKFVAKTAYADGSWQVSFVLPNLPKGTPVAFAIWDGSVKQRGGLKYYSLWHSLQ
ncbi:MAG: hypothetical protein HYX78_05665 [Armatimonadetes bacterium]|nr:hypothetical protein [Armatimonadota bacterium]